MVKDLATAMANYYKNRGCFLYEDDEGEIQCGNINETIAYLDILKAMENPTGKPIKFYRLNEAQ